MSENKQIFAIPRVQFNDMMKHHKLTLDNIEDKKKVCFISINETLEQDHPDVKAYFTENRSNLLVLFFDDIEEDFPIMHKGKREVLKAFTEDQAKQIVEFIDKNKEKEYFFVNCAAGVSRSGAVSSFISDYFECDRSEFEQNNKHILPNGLVTALLKRFVRERDDRIH